MGPFSVSGAATILLEYIVDQSIQRPILASIKLQRGFERLITLNDMDTPVVW